MSRGPDVNRPISRFMSYFGLNPRVRQSGLGVFRRAILALTHMWNGPGCKIFLWLNKG